MDMDILYASLCCSSTYKKIIWHCLTFSLDANNLLTQLNAMQVTQTDLQRQLAAAKTELNQVKTQLALTTQQLNQCMNGSCPCSGTNQTQMPNLGISTTQMPNLGINTTQVPMPIGNVTTQAPSSGMNTTTTQPPNVGNNQTLLNANQTLRGRNYGVSPPIPFNVTQMQEYCESQGGYHIEIDDKLEYDSTQFDTDNETET